MLDGKPRELIIAVKDGALVIQGLLWPENRLLPGEDAVFHAESWPLALRFAEDERGVIRAVSIEGRPLRWGTVAGTLDEVT